MESIPEEKETIQNLYEVFAATRSIKKTADKMNELGYRIKVGGRFNSSTTRLLHVENSLLKFPLENNKNMQYNGYV